MEIIKPEVKSSKTSHVQETSGNSSFDRFFNLHCVTERQKQKKLTKSTPLFCREENTR
jgi:hypothetical protein